MEKSSYLIDAVVDEGDVALFGQPGIVDVPDYAAFES